jgi:putative membrane protein
MAGWWMGGWSWLWIALIVLAIVMLVLWISKRSAPAPGGRDDPGGQRVDALALLEERYARGEIDREEFEERRRTLRGGPP